MLYAVAVTLRTVAWIAIPSAVYFDLCCCGLSLISVVFFFSPDDIGTCWYILLSGSVFIKESMFLPRSRYGVDTMP